MRGRRGEQASSARCVSLEDEWGKRGWERREREGRVGARGMRKRQVAGAAETHRLRTSFTQKQVDAWKSFNVIQAECKRPSSINYGLRERFIALVSRPQ